MEQVVAFGPPPLPPKTRRSPPDSATVVSATADVFDAGYSITNGIREEVHRAEVIAKHAPATATTTTTAGSHVVKIRINPDETISSCAKSLSSFAANGDILCTSNNHNSEVSSPCIRINVNADSEMIQTNPAERAFFYYSPFNCNTIMSSGQVSPSDTLDSGTCSDLDSTPPPPLPAKSKSGAGGVSVTVIGAQHKRAASLTSSGADADSDDNESNISCDSLNSGELRAEEKADLKECKASAFLPQGLLQDIRERSVKLSQPIARHHNKAPDADEQQLVHDTNDAAERISDEPNELLVNEQQHTGYASELLGKVIIEECTYEERRRQQVPTQPKHAEPNIVLTYESDKFINFHVNENLPGRLEPIRKDSVYEEDESFAGFKDLLRVGEGSSTIRSAKGTIRGVKNRVRAGIATFLNINDQAKTYKEKDAGKVVVYTTTMGIVRDTYQSCMKVKQILRTQLVRFEERDVFMSTDYQAEIRDRMRADQILVPQVFVDGQHVGDAETIEKLNESGELRRILKPYKTMDACTTCKMCGGYNLLPCPVCNGSKKSVHRNHFTAEFVALKCMNCDEVGLVKCTSCAL